jgi:hypothetical protein
MANTRYRAQVETVFVKSPETSFETSAIADHPSGPKKVIDAIVSSRKTNDIAKCLLNLKHLLVMLEVPGEENLATLYQLLFKQQMRKLALGVCVFEARGFG